MVTRVSLFLGVVLIVVYLTGCGGSDGGNTTDASPRATDKVAPTAISHQPEHNSSDIPLNISIPATFDEDVDPATITPDTVLVVDDITGETLEGEITYDHSSKTAIFRNAELLPDSIYTVALTTGIKDLAGNPMEEDYTWQFTTGESLDTTSPTVVNTFPVHNSLNVSLNSVIVATFSEAIDPSTVNAQNIILQDNEATEIKGSLVYTGTSALFKPTENMITGEFYTVTITTQVKDLAGNGLSEDDIWSFTTGAGLDTFSPQVIMVSPLDGEQNVSLDAALAVSFNEPIMPFEHGHIDGRPVKVSFDASYKIVSLRPTDGLSPRKTYTASILVSDMAQNLMPETFSWSFTTSP